VSAEEAAIAWAARERAYWARIERERDQAERRAPTQRIY
jgi:hypothetical protein